VGVWPEAWVASEANVTIAVKSILRIGELRDRVSVEKVLAVWVTWRASGPFDCEDHDETVILSAQDDRVFVW
jgi:hypothetical protein